MNHTLEPRLSYEKELQRQAINQYVNLKQMLARHEVPEERRVYLGAGNDYLLPSHAGGIWLLVDDYDHDHHNPVELADRLGPRNKVMSRKHVEPLPFLPSVIVYRKEHADYAARVRAPFVVTDTELGQDDYKFLEATSVRLPAQRLWLPAQKLELPTSKRLFLYKER